MRDVQLKLLAEKIGAPEKWPEIAQAIAEKLSDREKELIELRFGLWTGHTLTLAELGGLFGVTRERIRQVEAKALEKVKATL